MRVILTVLLSGLCLNYALADTKKILVVGNSFSYDAVLQEFLPIVQSAGDDIVLGFPYKGGTTLELHWQYMTEGTQIYNYYTISGGKQTSTGGSTKKFDSSIITSQAWDVVVIQTDHNYSGAYDHYFPYLTNIINYLKENLTNKDAKFYLYMTWAYQDGSAKIVELINKGLYSNQADQYNKIVDCAGRAAVQSGIGEENIIPGGTAVQNGRTSYIGDNYNRDGYHMNMEYGRYTVALTWYEKIFGKSALDVTYKPSTITDFCANMCRTAAHAAIVNPTSVTSLSNEYGVNPDATFNPLDRNVLVNFGIGTGELPVGTDVWNNLTSFIEGASPDNIYNVRGYNTDLKVSVVKPFAGVVANGKSATTNAMNLPSNASRSSFYGNSDESSLRISGLYPGQKYDITLFASTADAADAATVYTATGATSGKATLTVTDNADNTAVIKDIAADETGRIQVAVSAEQNGAKYYLGAMMLTPHLEIPTQKAMYINFTVDGKEAGSGWNNFTSHTASTTLSNMIDEKSESTSISMTIIDAFAGTHEDGASATNIASMPMPDNASTTGFWVNGIEKDGVKAENAKIKISGLDPNNTYDFYMYGSKKSDNEVYETEYSTFGATDNFIALNCDNNSSNIAKLEGIKPDSEGVINFTVTPGATSEDSYKLGFINAMAVMLPDTKVVVPFEPVAKDPWDGTSAVEPACDSFGNYIIYCGAELAWIAQQVNAKKTVSGVKLASDIDLGSKEWTPIGYGTDTSPIYFTGKFDGQGYHIRNFYLNGKDLSEKGRWGGLFGGTNSEACDISNIYISGVIDVPTTSSSSPKTQVGSFIGKANALGKMTNCHSDVNINITGKPGYVGGIIGFIKNCEIRSCSYSGTITVKGSVSNGIAGLIGTSNSSLEGIEATVRGCYFNGEINYTSTTQPAYVAAFNSYSNLSKAAETITDNYATGKITFPGAKTGSGIVYGTCKTKTFVTENNFAIDTYSFTNTTGTSLVAEEKFHSGEVAWNLNGDQMDFLFGQDLDDANSLPVVYTGQNRVYKTTFTVNNAEYAVKYSNAELHLPAAPDIDNFIGWVDANGKAYVEGDVIETDMALFALTKTNGIEDVADAKASIAIVGNNIVITSNSTIGLVKVYRVDGREMLSTVVNDNTAVLPIADMTSGIYVVSTNSQAMKLVKK
jgi:hypothetical protein